MGKALAAGMVEPVDDVMADAMKLPELRSKLLNEPNLNKWLLGESDQIGGNG